MPPFLAAFCFLSLLLMLPSVFRLLRLYRHLIVALHGHQLMQAVAFPTVIVVALVFLRNDTYERVQTVPHLWRCKKQSAGAVNEQMPREIALTRHLQHFAYKAVRDA